ncbi:sugar-transfer associated ATP-grasp domain-containing protein [Pseudothauera rhizosphaerae]|uniref:Alpha-L-glutamate ligase-related protein ATP-grasp domain-containing protein n=1 Tax=Pseudothauera rhizosphaerae TaxID=2565932 RepID=A0A4V6RX46_9RHOO|nr:sugar-transfer associated ATP-grasp domain-containing protein [Pseudothauera rhizosphaerae]THF61610.1 hypothetical protein E6O51_09145 [Pseudothauera rhizosphaerae]
MLTRLRSFSAVMARKAGAGGLPFSRQLAEMAWLYVFRGLGPGYYLMARFWRPELPFAEKAKHWNGRKFLRFVHRINDPAYFKISQNKLSEKCLLAGLRIPTTPLMGLFHPRQGHAVAGRPLTTVAQLEAVLKEAGGGGFFFKPAEGDSGRGVFALDTVVDGERLLFSDPISGAAVSADELEQRLLSSPAGYVVERTIAQHEALAQLNPSSVNTLRIWVVHDCGGVHVVGAFLRVGRVGSVVDNTAAGGLACAIDLESGVIVRALDLTLERNEHLCHPDSGRPLQGLQIPYWKECVEVACTALRVLPGARFSGMDIAVTGEGPLVVEYNVEANQRGATHFDVPHGTLFSGFETQ